MAFSMNKTQMATIAALVSKLRDQAGEIEDAVNTVNDQIADLVETQINSKVNAYNDTLSEAKELVSTMGDDFRTAFDEKSEKWQQSDRGVDVERFVSTFEEADLNDVDPVTADPIAVEVGDDADTLEQLPEEV